MNRPLRVLVVDDSALIQTLIAEIVNAQPDMTVVGTAGDPFAPREKIQALDPDVSTSRCRARTGWSFLSGSCACGRRAW